MHRIFSYFQNEHSPSGLIPALRSSFADNQSCYFFIVQNRLKRTLPGGCLLYYHAMHLTPYGFDAGGCDGCWTALFHTVLIVLAILAERPEVYPCAFPLFM
jgi:hypothetical protein